MKVKRTDRLNSLLREVISEVIHRDVRNPNIHSLISVTQVDISPDLHYAKVYISVIADDAAKKTTIEALQKSASFIGLLASKKVVMRYFPQLTFKLDDSVDKQLHIQALLDKIEKERQERGEEKS